MAARTTRSLWKANFHQVLGHSGVVRPAPVSYACVYNTILPLTTGGFACVVYMYKYLVFQATHVQLLQVLHSLAADVVHGVGGWW